MNSLEEGLEFVPVVGEFLNGDAGVPGAVLFVVAPGNKSFAGVELLAAHTNRAIKGLAVLGPFANQYPEPAGADVARVQRDFPDLRGL